MLRRRPIIASLVLIMLSFGSLRAQWIRTAGPEGGQIGKIVSDGADLYAASGVVFGGGYANPGDVYRSTDLGTTWISIAGSIAGHGGVTSLAVTSTWIIAGTRDGIFRHPKNGTTWDSISPGQRGYPTSVLLASDSDLIAGLDNLGLYRSTDVGKSWKPLASPVLVNQRFSDIDRLGNFIFLVTSGKGVFRSSDGGSSWNEANTGIPGADQYGVCLYHLSGVEIVGTLRGAYRSLDNGMGWESCRTGMPDQFGPLDFVSEGQTQYTIYANMGQKGIYSTTDFGDSWVPMSIGLPLYSTLSGLALTSGSLFTGVNRDGIFRTATSAKHWENASHGINSTSVFALRELKSTEGVNTLCAGTLDADFGLGWRSTTQGDSWSTFDSMTRMGVIDFAMKDGILFAGTSGEGVYISSDNGAKWKQVSQLFAGASYISSITATPHAVIAGVSGLTGVLRTADLGQTWTTPLASASAGINRVFYDSTTGLLFAGATFGFFTSPDEGANWIRPKTSIDSASIFDFARIGNALLAGTYFGIYRSIDNGATWRKVDSLVVKIKVSGLLAVRGAVYAATNNGVFISNDSGQHWQQFQSGLPAAVEMLSLAADENSLYVGTSGCGVWKTSLMASGVASRTLPTGSLHAENISEGIRISYSLKANSAVELSLCDINGRSLGSVLHGSETAGFHQLVLSKAELVARPSGTFFVILKTDQISETAKICWMK